MKGDIVPDTDHVSRYCSFLRLLPNGRPSGAAFRLRSRNGNPELYLSVNWLEFLKKGNREEEINEIRKVLSKKLDRVGAKAKIAVLNVGEMSNYVSERSEDGRKIKAMHEPEPKDPSHSSICGLQLEDDAIADLIAQTIKEIYPAKING